MSPDPDRCPLCGIVLQQVTVKWCRWDGCMQTRQRQPTQEQRRLYRLDEAQPRNEERR